MERLFALFEEMGYKNAEGFFRQGSLTDETYPDEFFTFWNIDSPYLRHRDNKAKEHALYIQVGFYTNKAIKIYSSKDENGQIISLSQIDDFCKRARSRGFIVEGEPKDANADKKGYFGRVCYIRIITKTEE